ncbi:hypothetical protein BGZ96_008002 [Linnemannia gamsii]|uniref:Protein kinase domain-containing protein n=1 Tax=Linnemannia gamsii TaxID=64522 RepID=A0ABQ7KE26_9FUNG|nr:hypothetical protein BGZ96_008002 [Linnemannia gamsii]
MFNFIKTGVSRMYGVTEDDPQPQQTADMDSMPDLVHSDEFSTSSPQRMSSDSNTDEKTKPLEDHKARIPSYGNQLKQNQLLRQREYQARFEQEQLGHHLRHLEGLQQQQRVGVVAHNIASPADYLHSPQSPFSPVGGVGGGGVGGVGDLETEQKQQEQLYRYHQLYQQQLMQEQHRQQEQQQQQQQFQYHPHQQQQQQYAQGGGLYNAPGSDTPSLSHSDNSSAASLNMQSAYHGPSQPMPAGPGANIGGAGRIFDMAAAAGLGGGGVNGGGDMGGGAIGPGEAAVAGGVGRAAPQFLDHELFLTSVLNAIAPWMDGDDASGNRLEQVDYQSEFTQRQMLAVGGNGEIRKAFWGSRNVFVVLKSLLDSKHHTAAKNASMFDKEVEVMRLCGRHENIVQFYGIANKHHPDHRIERFMIMQFYNHGDLNKLIHLPRDVLESPSTHERMILALDIAVGLEHLLRCGFHHGDLHPKNVLIDARHSNTAGGGHVAPRYQARLTDFGLRRIRGSLAAQSSQPLGGVLQFMAPERMVANKGVNRPRYDIRCDIFALGVIYWFIIAGRYPFKDVSPYNPGAREERVEGTADWYFGVYSKAWKEDPNERQQSYDEITQVFQFYLGIPAVALPAQTGGSTLLMSSSSADGARGGAVPHAYPSPPYAQGSQLMGSFDARYGNNNPSGTRGGGAGYFPSPALSVASGGATSGTSSPSNKPSRHPGHPANRKTTIPNGMQGRPRGN